MAGKITANMVTGSQLEAGVGTNDRNYDTYCWVMENVYMLGKCPEASLLGMTIVNGVRQPANLSGADFLDTLRNYQLGVGAENQAPGGNVYNTAPPVGTTTPTGMGLLGPTDCKFCQTLQQNPLLVVVGAIALYYLLFE